MQGNPNESSEQCKPRAGVSLLVLSPLTDEEKEMKSCYEYAINIAWDKEFLGIGQVNSLDVQHASFQFYLNQYNSSDVAVLVNRPHMVIWS